MQREAAARILRVGGWRERQHAAQPCRLGGAGCRIAGYPHGGQSDRVGRLLARDRVARPRVRVRGQHRVVGVVAAVQEHAHERAVVGAAPLGRRNIERGEIESEWRRRTTDKAQRTGAAQELAAGRVLHAASAHF
jgi:hypothetical protein